MTVARVTEITAASSAGFQGAVEQALSRAAQTLRGISGLEVISQKAKVEDRKITEYGATIEVTFAFSKAKGRWGSVCWHEAGSGHGSAFAFRPPAAEAP